MAVLDRVVYPLTKLAGFIRSFPAMVDETPISTSMHLFLRIWLYSPIALLLAIPLVIKLPEQIFVVVGILVILGSGYFLYLDRNRDTRQITKGRVRRLLVVNCICLPIFILFDVFIYIKMGFIYVTPMMVGELAFYSPFQLFADCPSIVKN